VHSIENVNESMPTAQATAVSAKSGILKLFVQQKVKRAGKKVASSAKLLCG
jgi:hypothetical protein